MFKASKRVERVREMGPCAEGYVEWHNPRGPYFVFYQCMLDPRKCAWTTITVGLMALTARTLMRIVPVRIRMFVNVAASSRRGSWPVARMRMVPATA